ncbi:MAG: GAF domain-containing protein, partial [Anaerolineaceae bacterium]
MKTKNPRSTPPELYQISRHFLSTLNLDEVVSRILSNAVGYVGAERGMLIVLDDKSQPDTAALFLDGRLIASSPSVMADLLGKGLAGWALKNKKTALVTDTSRDERWVQRPDDAPGKSGPKSAICAPVMLNSEKPIGVLTLVHSQPGFLNQGHAGLLEAVADQAAIAIYNAQQYRSMENSQAHYQQLFEDNIDAVIITRWDGAVQEANRMAGRMTGYTRELLVKKNITELHHPDWAVLGEDFSALRSGEPVSYESELLCREPGKTLPVQVSVQKIVFNNEGCLQWVLRDITAQKELDTLRSELQAMVYHDLRSPLTNVVSSLDMIREMLPAEQVEDLQPLVAIALRATDRVKRLADTLLDIHVMEAGQAILHMEEVDLAQAAVEAVEAVRAAAEARQHRIVNSIPADLPPVQADPEIMKRVLINLLENAVKFTPPEGRIELGGRKTTR